MLYLVVMGHLGPPWVRGRFEIHCSNFALSEAPVLDGRDFLQTGSERLIVLPIGRLIVVHSACDRSLVGEIEVCMREGVLVVIRSLWGWNLMDLPNLWLRCPCHSCPESL